jgi:hypothetical protein
MAKPRREVIYFHLGADPSTQRPREAATTTITTTSKAVIFCSDVPLEVYIAFPGAPVQVGSHILCQTVPLNAQDIYIV